MPVEVEVHTVPHFKAPVNAKVELWGLECGGTFIIQTSLLKIGCLVHKLGFVATEVAGTVVKKCQKRHISVFLMVKKRILWICGVFFTKCVGFMASV